MVNHEEDKVAKKRAKIVHVLADEPTGGVGTFLKETLTDAFSYTIVENIRDEESSFNQTMRQRGIEVVGFPRYTKLGAYISRTRDFYRKNVGNIAAIHVHSTAVAGIHLFFAKWYGIPHRIIHLHSAYYTGISTLKRWRNKLLMAGIFALSNQVVACGPLVAKSMVKTGEVTILPNTLPVSRFAFDEAKRQKIRQQWHLENRFVFACVGRYALPKNQLFLIQMMRDLLVRRPEAVLVLIGDGKDRPIFEQAIAKAGLTDKVILTGMQSDILSWYCAADALLMPSFWEGFPLTAIEAQATGLPCLLSERIDPSCQVLETVAFLSLEDEEHWKEAMCSSQPIHSEDRVCANQKIADVFDAKVGQEKLEAFYRDLVDTIKQSKNKEVL